MNPFQLLPVPEVQEQTVSILQLPHWTRPINWMAAYTAVRTAALSVLNHQQSRRALRAPAEQMCRNNTMVLVN